MSWFQLKLITFHSESCQSLSDVAFKDFFSGLKCHICPLWSMPSAAVPVLNVSVYLYFFPPVQTHFAPFNPPKSHQHDLIQVSTTKENGVLKWTLKAFAFEPFIGTGSLISLKSPLIHFSVSLSAVVRVWACVFYSGLTTEYLTVASQDKFPSLTSRAEWG